MSFLQQPAAMKFITHVKLVNCFYFYGDITAFLDKILDSGRKYWDSIYNYIMEHNFAAKIYRLELS